MGEKETKEIALRLSVKTAAFLRRFLPSVSRGLSDHQQTLTMGCTFKFTMGAGGLVEGTVEYHPPRILVGKHEKDFFVLETNREGFAYAMDGKVEDIAAEIAKNTGEGVEE